VGDFGVMDDIGGCEDERAGGARGTCGDAERIHTIRLLHDVHTETGPNEY
jgi:hypothetical protein